MSRLGYCCINLELQKEGIRSNRGMIKRTWLAKGLPHASKLALLNVIDLQKTLEWNVANDIKLFRMTSDLFPWMSEYEFDDLPDFDKISASLLATGNYAKHHGLRLTFHPGHFNVLASPTKRVVENSIVDLNQHSRIMDLMDLPASPEAAINIHVNGTYGDKRLAFTRFAENFKKLDLHTQKRLTLENDDKPNQWSVQDLHNYINFFELDIPIVFDYHHHRCHPDGLTENGAITLAKTTWPQDVIQLCHYSSTKQHESPDSMYRAHADFLYEDIDTYNLQLDIELEAKRKENARQYFIDNYSTK